MSISSNFNLPSYQVSIGLANSGKVGAVPSFGATNKELVWVNKAAIGITTAKEERAFRERAFRGLELAKQRHDEKCGKGDAESNSSSLRRQQSSSLTVVAPPKPERAQQVKSKSLTLPIELWEHIFLFLDVRAEAELSEVSKEFCRLVKRGYVLEDKGTGLDWQKFLKNLKRYLASDFARGSIVLPAGKAWKNYTVKDLFILLKRHPQGAHILRELENAIQSDYKDDHPEIFDLKSYSENDIFCPQELIVGPDLAIPLALSGAELFDSIFKILKMMMGGRIGLVSGKANQLRGMGEYRLDVDRLSIVQAVETQAMALEVKKALSSFFDANPRLRSLTLGLTSSIGVINGDEILKDLHDKHGYSLTALNFSDGVGVSDQGCDFLARSHKKLERLETRAQEMTTVGLKHLGQLKNLTDLTLTHMQMSSGDIETVISSKTKHLDLTHCSGLSEGALRAIAKSCQELENLHLSFTEATDEGVIRILRSCKKLKSLFIAGCNISDEVLLAAKDHDFLTELNVSRCPNITKEACQRLQQQKPHMRLWRSFTN